MRQARAHLAVAFGFAAVAIVWTLPLALRLSTDLPGAAVGDNTSFLWNVWWMRRALASGGSTFFTTSLFAPVGTDLVLHTHTALSAFAAATALRPLSPITALNVTIIVSIALNGFAAYLAAWDITRDRVASLIGGLLFGCSPYVAAHLMGHFNLVGAWTIPLFTLLATRAIDRQSTRAAIAAGVVLGITAFNDYYYVVYEGTLLVVLVVCAATAWSLRVEPSPRRAALAAVAALAVVDALVIALIASGHGFTLNAAGMRLSARELFNPLQVLWILIMLGAWIYLAPRISVMAARACCRPTLWKSGVVLATAALVAAPIVWRGLQLVAAGQYVSQPYFWRSNPTGIDAATLLLGNPFNGMLGSRIRQSYSTFGIDPVESVAWIGLVPMGLTVVALRRRIGDGHITRWLVVCAVFTGFAFGTHVHLFGWNTGMIAPGAILQFIPIVSNARMPGRAIVVVYLGVAMLGAISVSATRKAGTSPVVIALIAAGLVIDSFAAPLATVSVECPPIYQLLRDRPERGTVAELPVGFGDGLGALTPVDNRAALACQPVHEHPLVGGFVARLSPRVVNAYRADPLLAAFLRLSSATGDFATAQLPDRSRALELLTRDGISFVVLNRAMATAELQEYVDRVLPVDLIATIGQQSLYVTEDPRDSSPQALR